VQVRNRPIIENHVVMYDTIIEVENPEGLLKPGMTATVSIITDEKSDVLRVRNVALRARLPDVLLPSAPVDEAPGDDVRHTVYRVGGPGGRLEAVRVSTGMTDGVHTEIVGGLSEGDVLATGIDLTARDDERRPTRLFGPEPAQF
jgi:HlyD family secretion protein